MANYLHNGFAATPYALKLAAEYNVDLSMLMPSGRHGEIRADDVKSAAPKKRNMTPLARRMYADMNIDISTVAGSGFGGKITSKDLLNVSAASERDIVNVATKQSDAALKRISMSAMRKTVAKRMTQSYTEIPTVTQNIEVDVTKLLALREDINKDVEKKDRISVNDLILKATAVAVREYERFRMQIDGDAYLLSDDVHIGMAVGLDDGLIVPVIKDADKKSVFEISRESKLLISKAREKKLTPDDYGMGVITVSNLGMYGTHSFTPIINQPEAAILGVNAPTDRLMLENGMITVHQIMILSLTYDHRIINGTEAAVFENRIKYLLEHPAKLLLM